MKPTARIPIAGALLALALAAASASSDGPHPSPVPDRSGVAVVELFTSEGCSSCPPADALLERIAHDAGASGSRVYALSLHVDYWDHLGWRDPFSSAAATRRQARYARRFGLRSLYTPEIVVNGDGECIGSNAGAVQVKIDQALARPSEVTPELSVTASGRELRVLCGVPHVPQGATLSLAWVRSRAVSAPDAGENRGRALRHANVLRELETVGLTPGFHQVIVLHRDDAEDGEVIGWVQAANQGSVLGAAAVAVPAVPSAH